MMTMSIEHPKNLQEWKLLLDIAMARANLANARKCLALHVGDDAEAEKHHAEMLAGIVEMADLDRERERLQAERRAASPVVKAPSQSKSPPAIPWKHTAGRAVRRVEVHTGDHLIGLDALLNVLQGSAGPWNDRVEVRDFLNAHELQIGDVIDVADAEGVNARLAVSPRGLGLIWCRDAEPSPEGIEP